LDEKRTFGNVTDLKTLLFCSALCRKLPTGFLIFFFLRGPNENLRRGKTNLFLTYISQDGNYFNIPMDVGNTGDTK
jgi:hypothetical protein